MKPPISLVLSVFVLGTLVLNGTAAPASRLLFSDDFNRSEATPVKEDIGSGWTSNSDRRAKGNQQVFLKNGEMHVTKHSSADHGVAIFHDVTFEYGEVSLRGSGHK